MSVRHVIAAAFFLTPVTLGASAGPLPTVEAPPPPPPPIARVFVFAGQSNMGGYGASDLLPAVERVPNPNILAHQLSGDTGEITTPEQVDQLGKTWAPYAPGQLGQFHSNNGSYGPEYTAIKAIKASSKDPVYIIKFSVGGTSLARDWNSRYIEGAKPGLRYGQLVAKINAGLGALRERGMNPYVAGFFWMQGEADSFVYPDQFAQLGVTSTDAFAKDYEKNLRNLIDDLRVSVNNAAVPFIIGETADQPPPFRENPAVPGHAPIVRAAQAKIAQTVPWVHLARSTDLAKLPDGVHLSGESLQTLGNRMAAGWTATIRNGSFEADSQWSRPPDGWKVWSDAGTLEASYVESRPGTSGTYESRSGKFHGVNWWKTPYRVYTYQYLTGLPKGTYRLSAWVKVFGGQKVASFDIHGHGADQREVVLSSTITPGVWQEVVIPSVRITSGVATVGFWSDGVSGSTMYFDDVDLKLLQTSS